MDSARQYTNSILTQYKSDIFIWICIIRLSTILRLERQEWKTCLRNRTADILPIETAFFRISGTTSTQRISHSKARRVFRTWCVIIGLRAVEQWDTPIDLQLPKQRKGAKKKYTHLLRNDRGAGGNLPGEIFFVALERECAHPNGIPYDTFVSSRRTGRRNEARLPFVDRAVLTTKSFFFCPISFL